MSYGMPAEPPQTDVPVCPRHPDRVSYVRCQRCGRPACPECQRTASVGIQCVDCVRETSRTTPAVRTVYGGAAAMGRPVVTLTLIGICAVAYVLQWVIPGFTEQFLYAPLYTLPNPYLPAEPWRMITSAFLYSPNFLLHIAFNLYALWILGRHLEPLLGRLRFLALYLLSGFGGSVGVLALGAQCSRGRRLRGDLWPLRGLVHRAAAARRRSEVAVGADRHQCCAGVCGGRHSLAGAFGRPAGRRAVRSGTRLRAQG